MMASELDPLIAKVWRHCESTGNRGRTVTLKVKFADFEIITRSRSVPSAVTSRGDLAQLAIALLEENMPVSKPLRLLGVSLSSLQCEESTGPTISFGNLNGLLAWRGRTVAGFVGAQHEFHDAAFVRGWADRFVPTAPRLQLFDLVLDQIDQLSPANPHVLELGIGPGYMARHILERSQKITYEGLDFSEVFFDIAKETVSDMLHRVTLTKADLMNQSWPERLSRQPDAIISTWALHDLGGQQAVAEVYVRCYETLPLGGVLVNGDFIKPDGTAWEYEPGRFEISRHLELLRNAGFSHPKSLAHLERNLNDPTAAQNYACLVAVK